MCVREREMDVSRSCLFLCEYRGVRRGAQIASREAERERERESAKQRERDGERIEHQIYRSRFSGNAVLVPVVEDSATGVYGPIMDLSEHDPRTHARSSTGKQLVD